MATRSGGSTLTSRIGITVLGLLLTGVASLMLLVGSASAQVDPDGGGVCYSPSSGFSERTGTTGSGGWPVKTTVCSSFQSGFYASGPHTAFPYDYEAIVCYVADNGNCIQTWT